MVNREILLHKINDLLEGRLSASDIYSWVLSVAVTNEYQETVSVDPLLHAAFQDLMNIIQVSESRKPSLKVLVYYQNCLAGQEEFSLDIANRLMSKAYRRLRNSDEEDVRPPSKFYKGFFFLARGYIYLFAVALMGMHLFSLVNPEFNLFSSSAEGAAYVLKETIPHVTYAFILLVPFQWLVRTPWIFFTLPAMIFGGYYYWQISFDLMNKLAENPILFFIILPFGAVPASLALLLFMMEWKRTRAGRKRI